MRVLLYWDAQNTCVWQQQKARAAPWHAARHCCCISGLGSECSSDSGCNVSSSSLATVDTVLQAVLLARSTLAAGHMLADWHGANADTTLDATQIKQLAAMLTAAAHALTWLSQVLPTFVAAATGQVDDRAAAQVIQQCQEAEAAVQAVQANLKGSSQNNRQAVTVAQLLDSAVLVQLQQFGGAVCALLPTLHCCNNSRCVNMAKCSEVQLVQGRGCVCSGCSVARYCSRDCQVAHWKMHKPVCKKIKAAKEAARMVPRQ